MKASLVTASKIPSTGIAFGNHGKKAHKHGQNGHSFVNYKKQAHSTLPEIVEVKPPPGVYLLHSTDSYKRSQYLLPILKKNTPQMEKVASGTRKVVKIGAVGLASLPLVACNSAPPAGGNPTPTPIFTPTPTAIVTPAPKTIQEAYAAALQDKAHYNNILPGVLPPSRHWTEPESSHLEYNGVLDPDPKTQTATSGLYHFTTENMYTGVAGDPFDSRVDYDPSTGTFKDTWMSLDGKTVYSVNSVIFKDDGTIEYRDPDTQELRAKQKKKSTGAGQVEETYPGATRPNTLKEYDYGNGLVKAGAEYKLRKPWGTPWKLNEGKGLTFAIPIEHSFDFIVEAAAKRIKGGLKSIVSGLC